MNKYFAVTEVKPIEDYQLILTFSNGEKRLFDMKPHMKKGLLKELRDISLFNTAHISFDTVEWDNEADFDPEALYSLSEKIKGQKYFFTDSTRAAAAEPRAKYKKK